MIFRQIAGIYLISSLFACQGERTNVLNDKSPYDWVNPMIGTGYHGHTYPGATTPFGLVQLSPDTRRGNWDACSGYHYSDSTLFGFSHTHLSGTGCIDLGDILIRPTSSKPFHRNAEEDIFAPAPFQHIKEKAQPGYYAVTLEDDGIYAELTATPHVGVHRYTFSPDREQGLLINLAHLLDDEHIYEAELRQHSSTEFSGMRRTRGWVDNQSIYFYARLSRPVKQSDWITDSEARGVDQGFRGKKLQVLLDFDPKGGESLELFVALSMVSVDEAKNNLEKEVGSLTFDEVQKRAKALWEKTLDRIKIVEGGDSTQRVNFYTALYHTMLAPNQTNDISGTYRNQKQEISQLPRGENYYSTLSLWDTYRAWHPLMTLIDTSLSEQIIRSALSMYQDTGELPIWSLASGETRTMIGYHMVSVIADAYLKGIRSFDAEYALQAMVNSSNKNRKGSDYYTRLGYIPSNIRKESVSCTLEYAYDDWCIARMAEAMGKQELAQEYYRRAKNYVNVFDGQTKFFRPKREDGNWELGFDPSEASRAYTEATAWQYRFATPQDISGLISLLGGEQNFLLALDSLFDPRNERATNFVDITGLLGQYAHGNEPSHHMPYLYCYAGRPDQTQVLTRKLLQEMYQPTPEGLIGNEDCGQMSAWYLFSALGFYPVCPGSGEYVLTSPIFEHVTLTLANGNTLHIRANASVENKYIQRVMFNGREIETCFIEHSDLVQGGELVFELGASPSKTWGRSKANRPYSLTQRAKVSPPYITEDVHLFLDSICVQLYSATDGATIRYTLDGSEPTEQSPLYHQALYLKDDTPIKARAYKEGLEASPTFSVFARKAKFLPAREIGCHIPLQGLLFSYYEGKFKRVADIEKGTFRTDGICSNISLSPAQREDHYGLIFEGYIKVPETGVYTFEVKSDDGSMLYIDDQLVVSNDGSHSAVPATGRIALEAGLHRLKLLYFEDYEGQHLSWRWRTPRSQEFTEIPQHLLYAP